MSEMAAVVQARPVPGELLTLSADEVRELTLCEATIEAGLQTFYEVGTALLKIRDARLYRQDHGTFEGYCRDKWAMARRTVYQLMDAAGVINNVRNCAQILPANEAQARELASLDADAQKAVWQTAVETAPVGGNGKPLVTAAHIKSIVAANSGNGIEGDEWFTPSEYIDAARKLMGGIDLDPASCKTAQEKIQALAFYTAQDDALTKDWHGRVWLNPPYSYPLIEKFISRTIAQYEFGNTTQAVVLTNNCTDAGWFHSLLERYPVCFTRGRIAFWRPGQQSFATRQGQAFFYLGEDVSGFGEIFTSFGVVLARA